MIDWKEIFIKYVGIVSDAEGVDFLHREDWTKEEWKEIKKVIE